jgi:hypothetical protein
MRAIIIYSTGLCALSVCASNNLSIKEITKKVNLESPTGLDHEWILSKSKKFNDGTPMPCPCNVHNNKRKHYLFEC